VRPFTIGRLATLGFSLALAACGAQDGTQALLPTSPGPLAAAVDGAGYTVSSTPPPAGFVASFKSDPRSKNGSITGFSPLTVQFDLCDSTVDGGKTAFFIFDWEFDHAADVVGTGSACRQQHIYKVKAGGDGTFQTNVCVANGAPSAHDPKTFVSCRTFSLDVSVVGGRFCHSIAAYNVFNNFPTGSLVACPTGATKWCDSKPIDPTSVSQAMAACRTCHGTCDDQNPGYVIPTPVDLGHSGLFYYASFGCTSPGDLGNLFTCSVLARWAP
jgi:hypothetical protein